MYTPTTCGLSRAQHATGEHSFTQGCHPPRTLFNPCHHHKHAAGPPWPPGTFLVTITRGDRVGGSSLEDAALGTSESQAEAKTKGFGEPRSLEKELRCFSRVDVSFHSWFLIRAQTTCGPIPTLGWQCLPSYWLGTVHWAGHLRGKK